MSKQTLSITSDQPSITIKSHENVYIKGWDQKEVQVEGGSRHTTNVRQEGDTIFITSTDNCLVMVPTRSRLKVERVGGDAYIGNLESDLVIQKIGGDLYVAASGQIAVEQVGGQCQVQTVAGDLESHKIGGDFYGKSVEGGAIIERVGGDFMLQDSGCPVTCRAGGDIQVSIAPFPSGASNLSAGGDITLHLLQGSGATFNITSGSEDIHIDLGGHFEEIDERSYVAKVGDGVAVFNLHAGGDVLITDRPWDDDILEDVEAEIDERVQSFTDDFEAHFQDVTERVVNEAARRAEKRVQAAFSRIEQRMDFPGKLGGRKFTATFSSDFPFKKTKTASSSGSNEPVSNEERLMILKMVESKKISVEEAEKLLEALEAKG